MSVSIEQRLENIGLITSKQRPGIESVQLELFRGVSEPSIEQLIYLATHDPEVAKQTSDTKRFADRAAFEKWQAKGRTIYSLLRNGELAGVVWYGLDPMPNWETLKPSINPNEYRNTFAIRLYQSSRGLGLSEPFIRLTIEDFKKTLAYIQNPGIWLETSEDNLAAVNAYLKTGWVLVTDRADEHGRILMVHNSIPKTA